MRPKKVSSNDNQLQFYRNQSVTFDYEAFNELIASHGATFIHWRAMRCPIGLIDKYDVRKPDAACTSNSGCKLNCSNGFLYTKAGLITGVFLSNPLRERDEDNGYMQESSAQFTIETTYDDSDERIYIARYDRLYICEEDVTVQHWELVEAHATGLDRLSFSAIEVIDVVDNRGISYSPGDYSVEKGKIRWLSQNQPGQDIASGKGRIYSVRYSYRPYWYVKDMPHEIRISQTNEETGLGEVIRNVKRLPQTLMLQREHVLEKDTKSEDQTDNTSPRMAPEGRNGGFGPR